MEKKDFYVVGLAASAGGHEALKEFFLNLPEQPGMAFVVVTHLLRTHYSILDRIISRYTRMTVRRMKGVDIIRPNHVYVMPENVKVHVRDGSLILTPREDGEILNKTIDLFFHSLGEEQQEKAVAIIFSGMGSDGLQGAQTIHENGGMVLVQDPRSTQFRGMPEALISRDSPDAVLPPDELAQVLLSILSAKAPVERK